MKRFFKILIILMFNLPLLSQQKISIPNLASEAKNINYFTKVHAPSIYRDHNSLFKVQTLNISANYIGTWPPEAQVAFNYALEIWSYLINSSIPIKIKAEWKIFEEQGALAGTHPTSYIKNFTNAPMADVNFPVSLAEALSGIELNGIEDEINIEVNSNISWYYGLDGNTPAEKYDLVTVILHEIAHGLGFSESMYVENNIGSWGQGYRNSNENGFATRYDKFGVVGQYSTTIYRLTNTNQYPNPSWELGNALQSSNIYFDGPITKQMYSNNLPKLYAPNPFEGGSSLSHFDEDIFTAGNQNSLMTPKLGKAESIHSPGELGLAVLQDLGWNVNRLITILNPGPGLACVPGQTIEIKWTDNIGGAISIDLLKKDVFGNFEYYLPIVSHTSPQGSNSINWTIPNVEGTFKIRMIENINSGQNLGLSYPFIISTQAQVATPVILPPGSNYITPQTISISCATLGASIYYTSDGTDPSTSNGTQYSVPFSINSDMVIKAIAIKAGYPDSEIATEVFTISMGQPVVTVIPNGGTVPMYTKLEIIAPSGYDVRYNSTYDNTIPGDPSEVGGYYQDGRYYLLDVVTPYYFIKFQLVKDGIWGPVTFLQYNVKNSYEVSQVDDEVPPNGNGYHFGPVGIWSNNQWNPYQTPALFIVPEVVTNYWFKASQEFKPETYRKYNVWIQDNGLKYYVNHTSVPIYPNFLTKIYAHFKNTFDITISNKIENSISVESGSFFFGDPWLVDDDSDSKGLKNRGVRPLPVEIPYKITPNVTRNSLHKGVFLNQNPTFDPTKPCYSVEAISPQDIPLSQTGKSHRFYFQNWTGTNVDFEYANIIRTGVVFQDENAEASAVLKGTQLSNQSQALSNNGQRKIIRTDDGKLHCVYESLEKIWYEMSTDNGNTWVIMNNGQPVSHPANVAKSPSICLIGNECSILIVYQEKTSGDDFLTLRSFNYLQNSSDSLVLFSFGNSYEYDSAPVIDYVSHQDAVNRFLVVWKYEGNVNNWPDYDPGFYHRKGYLDGAWGDELNLENDFYPLSITDENSFNPSIVKHNIGSDYSFHLVWEQRQSEYQSEINYAELREDFTNSMENSYGEIVVQSFYCISDDCGSANNHRPTITFSSWQPRAGWIGVNPITYMYDAILTTVQPSRRIYNAYSAGNDDVTSVSINNASTRYVFAYTRDGGGLNRYVTSLNLSSPNAASTNGAHLQVTNGSALSNTYIMSFNNSSLPYYFQLSGALGSVKGKENLTGIGKGRGGIVSKDGASFLFAIGDVTVENNSVEYVAIPDSATILTTGQVNSYLTTEPFSLTDNSSMQFSVMYGIKDSASVVSSIGENDYVKFKVELVDASNGEVIGSFDEVEYGLSNLFSHNSTGYHVNTEGIGNRIVRLRLKIEDNLGGSYGISDMINEGELVAKEGYKNISYLGDLAVTDYALSQNYPNPFNPVTTINYQIPKDGFVSLKVYDILGKEIATLVNSDKAQGKYTVEFDGSRFASGMYIYKLQSGDFVETRKMMLLK